MSKDSLEGDSQADTTVKIYKPYFLPTEVVYLIQQNAGKLTPARVEALRQQACGFMDKVGSRLGFPRRTIATAQMLYHRFHLFFPLKDFSPQDVSVAALLVSAKLEDTLKKLREIQIAAHHVRVTQDGSRSISEPDPHILDADRARLVGIERLILETISFNFNLRSSAAYASIAAHTPSSQNRDAFSYVIKLSRHLGAGKDYARRAFQVAIDAHRTVVPLSFPPHAIAAACLFLPSLFSLDDVDGDVPEFGEGWEHELKCEMDDVEDVCHGIIDLYLSTGSSSANLKTSPSDNAPSTFRSPREAASLSSSTPLASTLPSTELTAIKIRLRNDAAKRKASGESDPASEVSRQKRQRMISAGKAAPTLYLAPAGAATSSTGKLVEKDKSLLGRDDVTVRFLWDAQATQ